MLRCGNPLRKGEEGSLEHAHAMPSRIRKRQTRLQEHVRMVSSDRRHRNSLVRGARSLHAAATRHAVREVNVPLQGTLRQPLRLARMGLHDW